MVKLIIERLKWIVFYPIYWLKHNCVHYTSRVAKSVYLNRSKVGKYCYIGANCDISYTEFGNYCCVANNVVIGGMEHPHWDLSLSPKLSDEFVYGGITHIGNDVWIATGCTIRQGVTIGDGAVVGAGSFVNKDVEPYSIVVGSPAVHLKYRDCKKIEMKLRDSNYWNYSPSTAKKILEQIKINNKTND